MKVKKEQKKGSSLSKKADSKIGAKPVAGTGGVVSDIANAKVSRRTLLRGTATAVAVVGVSSVAMKGMQFQPVKEQSASSSSTTSSTSTPLTTNTNTATLPAPPPVLPTDPTAPRTITLNVNNKNISVTVEPRDMLVDVLRDTMGLIATKRPCNRMECNACTVLIDGVPHASCTIMAIRTVGHSIMTAALAAADPVEAALDQAWVTADGGQCSYCGPGYIMTATALLKTNPNPSVDDIKAACSGNLCRCGNYMHIITAIQLAATNLAAAKSGGA